MLSDYLRSQAEWRRQEKKDYPMDMRNEKSAAALESLAEFVEGHDASGTVLDRLRPHLFDEKTLGGERTRRAVSRYGYGTAATRAHHAAFLEELGALCEFDAYEYAREHGQDRSRTLVAFELEAARSGVALPWQYFERRPRSTQTELQQAVEGYSANAAG